MAFSLQFLGTGTSVGVPQIGCTCPTCVSTDPRDRRRRTGAYVRSPQAGVLIDTPPEMRLSAVEYGITKVDAVVITHCHMDHIAGFDDVRRFNTLNGTRVACAPDAPGANGRDFKVIGKPLPCYAAAETIADLRRIFPYVSNEENKQGLFRPMIEFSPVADAFEVADLRFTPLEVEHGPRTNGYLVAAGGRRLAYISDCARIPPETLGKIAGVDVLVLDCLRERRHPTHLNRAQALETVALLKPARTFFVHMCHEVRHADFEANLPEGVRLAYDGLTVEV